VATTSKEPAMGEQQTYAVYLHPGAIEALGDIIKPYLTLAPAGAHVLCQEIDTGGTFCEMTIETRTAEGKALVTELMIPNSMIRMIVSTDPDGGVFGFA
jgi:hypothetical protein